MGSHWGSLKNDKSIDKPEWRLVHINADGIIVTWQEKYGSEKTEECIGLWENNSQYMLTWKDVKKVFIQKNNLNVIDFKDK